jgi:nucleoside-diphosphate-sugar epimerase
MNNLHVIFGTGPLGRSVAKELVEHGKQVRMVNRSGKADGLPKNVEVVAGDAYSLEFTRRVTEHAEVVYQCAQPEYHQWTEKFPALQQSILESTASNKAKLVIADNLYMYGDPNGQTISEASPEKAHTKKGNLRKLMAEKALEAHRTGKLQVALSRPSHYFGPGYDIAANFMFLPALKGKSLQLLGKTDAPHSFSYVPDAGRAMAILGTSEQSWGQVWIPPVMPAMTQREFAEKIWQAAGQQGKAKITSLNKWMLRMVGLFNPASRETVEMLYEFEKPYIVDSSKFEKTFNVKATPLDETIERTLEYYQTQLNQKDRKIAPSNQTTPLGQTKHKNSF